MKIPFLDGRIAILSIDQIITPNTIKKIENEGMIEYIPDQKKTDNYKEKRGDLFVKF